MNQEDLSEDSDTSRITIFYRVMLRVFFLASIFTIGIPFLLMLSMPLLLRLPFLDKVFDVVRMLLSRYYALLAALLGQQIVGPKSSLAKSLLCVLVVLLCYALMTFAASALIGAVVAWCKKRSSETAE